MPDGSFLSQQVRASFHIFNRQEALCSSGQLANPAGAFGSDGGKRMTTPEKGKAEGGNPRLFSNNPNRQVQVSCNSNREIVRNLLITGLYIKRAQDQLDSIALYTDKPLTGLVELADALDYAACALAKARGDV